MNFCNYCTFCVTFLGRVGMALESVVQIILGSVQTRIRSGQTVHIADSGHSSFATLMEAL
jgi:hypothetical protein